MTRISDQTTIYFTADTIPTVAELAEIAEIEGKVLIRNSRVANIYGNTQLEECDFVAGSVPVAYHAIDFYAADVVEITPAAPARIDPFSVRLLDATSILVEWVRPTTNGSAIVGYTLEYRVRGITSWINAGHTGLITQAVITGVDTINELEVRISAFNAIGNSVARVVTVDLSGIAPPTFVTDIAALSLWYRAADSIVVSGLVQSVSSAIPADTTTLVAPTGSRQVQYQDINGILNDQPSFIWPEAENDKVLRLSSSKTVKELIIIGYYGDGTRGTFAYDTGIVSNIGGTVKVVGTGEAATLSNVDTIADTVFVNDSIERNRILPTSPAVMRIVFDTPVTDVLQFGNLGDLVSGWQGAISEIIGFDNTLSTREITFIKQYANTKYDLGMVFTAPESIESIPNLQFYLNPEIGGSTITLSGSEIQQVNSTVGSRFASSLVSADRPQRLVTAAVGGHRLIEFENVTGQDGLALNAAITGAEFTIVTVFQHGSQHGAFLAGDFGSFYFGTRSTGRIRMGTTLSATFEKDSDINQPFDLTKIQMATGVSSPLQGRHEIYINGNLISTFDDGGFSYLASGSTTIGRAPVLGGVNRFDGFLGRTLIFNRALAPVELDYIHQQFASIYNFGTDSVL